MAGSRRVARLQAQRAVTASAKAAIAARAAGYIRVSTDEQAARGFGLEAQEKAIRAEGMRGPVWPQLRAESRACRF